MGDIGDESQFCPYCSRFTGGAYRRCWLHWLLRRPKYVDPGMPAQTSAADAWLPCDFETNRVAFLAERELMRPIYTIDPQAFVQQIHPDLSK